MNNFNKNRFQKPYPVRKGFVYEKFSHFILNDPQFLGLKQTFDNLIRQHNALKDVLEDCSPEVRNVVEHRMKLTKDQITYTKRSLQNTIAHLKKVYEPIVNVLPYLYVHIDNLQETREMVKKQQESRYEPYTEEQEYGKNYIKLTIDFDSDISDEADIEESEE